MAAVNYPYLLVIVLILEAHHIYANFDFPFPFHHPVFGNNTCKENVCGRGNCVASNNTAFGFECECEEGWRQARDEEDDDQSLNFLPCVVPNCTFNYTCTDADAPAPLTYHDKRSNLSFWDPCFWTDCGGGSCNKTSDSTHTCECEEGYFNLFNDTSFPCYRECAIGADCAHLGFGHSNSSAPPPNQTSNLAEVTNSRATSLISRAEFAWYTTGAISLAMLLWYHT